MIDLNKSLSFFVRCAEVVKLANTLRSGRSGRKLLRVQLPPSAILAARFASEPRLRREDQKIVGADQCVCPFRESEKRKEIN